MTRINFKPTVQSMLSVQPMNISTGKLFSDVLEERKRKLSKIVDKLNGVEHKYIESSVEYFQRKFYESTRIPKDRFFF